MFSPKKSAPDSSKTELDRIIKSQFINILRANPWLSRFYAGYAQLSSSNPNPTNNLADCYKIFRGLNPMSPNRNTRTCSHIKVNGLPCGSPALRRESFCYFHQRMIRGVATPPKSRLHPIALIENEEAIQASLMEVINALVRNTIDFRRAQLILRALHIAVKNSPRVHFQVSQNEMVREVPDYPAAPAPPKPPEPVFSKAAALARIKPPKTVGVGLPKVVALPALIDPTRPKPPHRVTAAATQARKAAFGHSG